MDPSDIIKTAFPLNQICLFVSLSGVLPILITWAWRRVLIMTSQIEIHQQSHKYYLSVWNTLSLIGLTTIVVHFSFILCGVHPAQFPFHTLLSALYVSTLTLLPITLPTPAWGGEIIANSPYNNNISRMKFVIAQLKEVAAYIFGPAASRRNKQSTQQQQQQQNRVQIMHQYSTLGTLIGMCAFAILRVLDHGMQIQRHPMPIIIGATAGRVCGVLFAVLWTIMIS